MFGTLMLSLPSFGVLLNTALKLVPPLLENKILTLLQLTGAAVVLATFQVTVWLLKPAQVTAVFGTVTWKGPAALTVVTRAVSKL